MKAYLTKLLAVVWIGLVAAALASTSHAQNYPNRPIRLIVPFAPGGSTDIIARLVGERLSAALGQPVVVENRVGAGGLLGTEAVAKAAPDGYTLGMATVSTLNVNPVAYRSLTFDVQRDLVPVTCVAAVPVVLTAGTASQIQSLEQLIVAAKARPGKLSYGTPGVGSFGHFIGEHFKQLAQVRLLHVPYKGSSAAVNDLLAGQVDLTFENLPTVISHVAAGKLRALGVASPARLDTLPGVPTFAEAGFPELNEMSWFGIVAPARTPPEIVRRIHAELKQAVERPEFAEKIRQTGAIPMVNSPTEFAQQIRAGIERIRGIATSAGIKLD